MGASRGLTFQPFQHLQLVFLREKQTHKQTHKEKNIYISAAPSAADERPRSRRMFARRIWFGAFCDDNTGRETRRLLCVGARSSPMAGKNARRRQQFIVFLESTVGQTESGVISFSYISLHIRRCGSHSGEFLLLRSKQLSLYIVGVSSLAVNSPVRQKKRLFPAPLCRPSLLIPW